MSQPWMPLYVRDYLADTGHLSAAEHGAYLMLIMHYWQHGELPRDDRALARLARMSEREWNKAKPTIESFFKEGWVHPRIDAELEKSRLKSAARAEAGARGGVAKATNRISNDVANATILPEQKYAVALASSHNTVSSSLRSEDTPLEKTKSPKPEDPRAILRQVLSDELADGVLEHRRKKRAALTAIAAKGLAKKFAATGHPDAAARMMIENGWQGFEVDWWLERQQRTGAAQPRAGPNGHPREPTTAEAFGMIADQFRKRKDESGQLFSEDESAGPIVDARAIVTRSEY